MLISTVPIFDDSGHLTSCPRLRSTGERNEKPLFVEFLCERRAGLFAEFGFERADRLAGF